MVIEVKAKDGSSIKPLMDDKATLRQSLLEDGMILHVTGIFLKQAYNLFHKPKHQS